MGVIKKILYRGNVLGKPRHKNLFLDMEENIHIHYRDLRIELSRGEFEDLAAIFAKQSAELLAIINEKKYQDGKLPNANQDDVRIWTESRLKHDVKYHPQRFSLEECGDGYHFHYRNYKLLIDKDEFRQITRLFSTLNLDSPYASSYDDVLELLDANDVDFTLDAGNVPGQTLAIQVAQHHIPKIRDIFKYIGFSADESVAGAKKYRNEKLEVIAKAERQRSAIAYRRIRGMAATERLVDFLAVRGAEIDPQELNLIKIRVLDLVQGIKDGKISNVDVDPQNWLYTSPNRQVIFPYCPNPIANPGKDAETLYRTWANLLAGFSQGFVKPAKDIQPADAQRSLKDKIDEVLRKEVASFAAVDKVYIMGSALRGQMGHYQVPFVHGRQAKLGSDIDILVELDPDREDEIPGYWNLHLPKASNNCAVYHIADIPLDPPNPEWQQVYPHVAFVQHLVDAYVYRPSSGYRTEIDAFLKKFGAKLVYDRKKDGTTYRSEVEARIGESLKRWYGFDQLAIEAMKVSTENALYKVFSERGDSILKLFKAAGNYSRDRIVAHTRYEEQLVRQLVVRGVPTADVISPLSATDSTLEGFPFLLYERIPGQVQQRPEYPIERITAALAHIHGVQLERPLEVTQDFPFDSVCMIWLPQFDKYLQMQDFDAEVAEAIQSLASIAAPCHPGENRLRWFNRSISVHCHGDVTPKNVIYGETGPARFFDFNNAFHGPRMADLIDGAIEFSLAEKYIHLADFERFDAFVAGYQAAAPISGNELEDLPNWIRLVGVIKFAKEIRVMLQRPTEALRRKRALAISVFLRERISV